MMSRQAVPPAAAPGMLLGQSRPGSSERPSWWARICYCLALAIGCVPLGLVTPSDQEYLPHPGFLLTLACIALGLLQLLLGATGLLLTRGASWGRRGLSVGIFAVITVCCVAAPYIAAGLLSNVPALTHPVIGVLAFLQAVFGGAIGSVFGQLACWNMVQHGPRWTYALAAFHSFIAGGVIAVGTMLIWFPGRDGGQSAFVIVIHFLFLIVGLGVLRMMQSAIDRRTHLSPADSPRRGQPTQTWPSDYPGHPGRSSR